MKPKKYIDYIGKDLKVKRNNHYELMFHVEQHPVIARNEAISMNY